MVPRPSARRTALALVAAFAGIVAAPLSASAADTYTLAQVQQHRTAADCWTLVDGGVYNVTGFITRHDGGRSVIESMCGIDATAAFLGEHGGNAKATSTLSVFRIGDGPATVKPTPTATPSATPTAAAKCPTGIRSALQSSYKAAAAARRAAGSAAAAAKSVKFKALLKKYTALHKAATTVCRQGLPTPAAVAR